MSDTTKTLEEMIVAAAEDKKATDVVVLNVDGVSSVADFYVVCSAKSTIQVQAIADNIEDELKKQGIDLLHKEGHRQGRWILLDFGNGIAHIFVEEEREYYNLERLWGKARVMDTEEQLSENK
ncbi:MULTISPECIES: ribosome silencing factor [Pelosinus]|uniref:Ribosomal silencing factor RsfS n=1 Tax=Pelosinus fermentans B4 TaxID=1149862 RepID=I9L9T6_9FIRM|nr:MULTISPECIES: ribosome silencing factor [Pelosinus]EIW17061.1 iojap-like protein [Pelosinus fermentans B4]EIW23140.1 iojap-like protein [Pelosinus fermentans A11]OAM93818.1 iojap-like protein [Pelosinus fermentans DSM 17108]SDQ91112.1 ribosome-associated protein [Pelosinus fermentans]